MARGVQHLNRNIVSDINDLFVISNPSEKSLNHIVRIKEIMRGVGIKYDHFYLVANHEFDEQTEEYLQHSDGTYLGKIDYDANVERYNLEGKSLLELPEDSPALLSIKRILIRANYNLQ